jgi:Family of unknown function (DUF6057)
MLQTLLFFGLFYAIVLVYIEPHLVHQRFLSDSVKFSRSWDHFVTLLGHSGGLVDYVSGHLLQYCAWDWVGALIITLTALGFTVATEALLRAGPANWWHVARFVPAVSLLVLWSQYDNPLGFGLGLLVALAGTVVYVRVAPAGRWLRLGTYLVVCAAVFYAGGWAWFVGYTAFCGVVEFRGGRRLHALVAWALGGIVGTVAAWPLLASGVGLMWERLWGFLGDGEAVGRLFVADGRLTLTTVAVALGVFYLLVAFCRGRAVFGADAAAAPRPGESRAERRRVSRRREKRGHAKPAAASPATARRHNPMVRWAIQTAVVLIVAAAGTVPLFDGEKKLWLELDYTFRRRLWPELLSAARRLPTKKHNPLVTHDVNRALYHTGRLPHEMFAYPQHLHALTLLPLKGRLGELAFNAELYERLADTFYELGRLNDAEHWSHELLQIRGDHPSTLQLLAKINVIKKQPAAARVYLNYMVSLHNDLEDESWGRAWLRRMEDDPLLADDEEVRRLRPLWQLEDIMALTRTAEGDLLALLKYNPRNRMAFEYLMAHYLLTCRVDRVVANLHRLDDYDYRGIPRHWEEAVLLGQKVSGKPADLCGRRIRPETIRTFEELGRRLGQFPATEAGRQARLNLLEAECADSYLFYFVYHVTRAAKGAK